MSLIENYYESDKKVKNDIEDIPEITEEKYLNFKTPGKGGEILELMRWGKYLLYKHLHITINKCLDTIN